MSATRRKRKPSRRTSRQFSDSRQLFRRPDSWLLFTVDALIAFLIIGFPFIMGGREAWGHTVLITTSLLLGGVWCIHQVRDGGRLVITGAELLAVVGFALLWAQTAPFGSATLHQLSPEYERLTSAWGATQQPTVSDAALTSWNTASLMPVETRHAMWILLAYTIVGVVTAQRVAKERDAERILKLVAVSGVSMAVFAAVQFTFSNDRFFWFYRNPFTGTSEVVKGAFTNRNHFAQFLVLSLGPLLWWLMLLRTSSADKHCGQSARSSSESLFDRLFSAPVLLLTGALGCVLLCIMLSLSRGGMIAAAVACLVVVVGLARSQQVRASIPLLLLLLGSIAIGGLLVFGSQDVETRVNQLASGDADDMDQMSCRRAIWAADFEAIRRFPVLGTGVGSHREVYPTYMTDLANFSNFEFTHAESTYVQLAMETGLGGLLLLVLGIALFGCRISFAMLRKQSQCRKDCLAAVAAALAAGSLHAVADFIWYVPAIVVVTVILCITGFRTASGFSERKGIVLPRFAWLALACLCAFGILQSQPGLYRRIAGELYWHQYLNASFDFANAEALAHDDDTVNVTTALEEQALAQSGQASSSRDATAGYAETPAAPDESDAIVSMKHRIGLLIRSLRANPHQPRAQVRMASLCLKLFDLMQRDAENPMTLDEIRDTALGVEFETMPDLQEWLDRAFGASMRLPVLADQLARRALSYCPVQGPAYLTLLDTGFLKDPADTHLDKNLEQVLTLRRYDPRTRFVAGQIALLAGDQAAALEHWGVVFHSNREFRESITLILSRAIPASVLLTEFEPSVTELPEVLAAYRRLDRHRQLEQVIFEIGRVTELQAAVTSPEERIAVLMDGYEAAWSINLPSVAEDMLRRAIACDETAYWPKHALGLLLFQQKQYDEAGDLFTWCYDQEPGDTKLERLVRDSRRLAHEQNGPFRNVSFSNP
jgi:O-antigen ligase/tetratricopeptide (TPR) repeat protein